MGKQIRKKQAELAQKESQWLDSLKTKKPVKQSKRNTYEIKLPKEVFSRVFVRDWSCFKTRSHNQQTRNLEALKYLFCQYMVFAWLPAMYLELAGQNNANEAKIALDLLVALGSGRSGREILKQYLSKRELAAFTRLLPEVGYSLFEYLIYCKAKARNIPQDVALQIPRLIKKGNFASYFMGEAREKLESLLDFVEREEMSKLAFEDFFDFYVKECKMVFSFKGRTLRSVLNLVNEWHVRLNRLERIRFAEMVQLNRLK